MSEYSVHERLAAANQQIGNSRQLRRLLVFLLPAATGMYAMYQGIQQILIPAQVESLDPVNKVANLALLTTLAAVASMVAIPAGGAISDRTRGAWGRRTPWIVGTSFLAGFLMIAMGFAGDLAMLGIIYTALWFVGNFYQGAFSAILPDRVPEDRRGIASAVIGLGTPLGILVGVNVASRVGQVWGYTALAILLIVTTLALTVFSKEEPSTNLPKVQKARLGLSDVRAFFSAFRSRDFTLAFCSRFALFLAYFVVSGYLYYTLSDYVGEENIPTSSVAAGVSLLSSVNVVAWVVVATFCGWLADKLDMRKVFVGISAVAVGTSMLIPILMPTWEGMLFYSIFSGAAIGTYFAVDLALMSLVLPNKANEGRDFGILAVATGLPQIMSSAIAGSIILYFGGYSSLYIFGAIFAAIAGIIVFGIKKVR